MLSRSASLVPHLVAKAAPVAAPVKSVVEQRVAAARFLLFGHVDGGGKRSGRKVVRRAVKGETLDSWYPYTMKELSPPG